MTRSPAAAPPPPVVVVAGPTAAGKTPLAVELAEQFAGEILNADSMQVYRYLEIGTAKPSPQLRSRVPHHLYDIAKPNQAYDAGRYSRDARRIAADIHGRAKRVFLCGGTGLYIRSFLEGLLNAAPADPVLRKQLQAEAQRAAERGDGGALHRRLASRDPESAARIHANDRARTIRALEILDGTGIPASELRSAHGFRKCPYRVLYLVVDPGREALDARIERRAQEMIEAGLLREARALRRKGYGPELRPLQSIGYRHITPVVDGQQTLDQAQAAIARDTRRFARRQRTWFRGVPGAVWIHPERTDEVRRRVARFLGEPDPP